MPSGARRALYVLVLASIFAGAFSGAKQFYSRHYGHLANQYINIDRAAESQLAAARAIKLNPYNGYAHYQAGTVHFSQEEFDQALQYYNAAEPVLPHIPQLLRLRGQSHYQLGNFADASADMADYFRMVPSPTAAVGHLLKMAALSHLQAEEFGLANATLLRTMAEADQAAEALRARVTLGVLINQPEIAIQAIEALIARNQQAQIRGPELLKNAITANRLPVLITTLEQFRANGGTFPGDLHTLVATYTQANRTEQAIQLLQASGQELANDSDLQLMLGDLLYKAGRRAEALDAYDAHLRLKPDSRFREEIERRRVAPE